MPRIVFEIANHLPGMGGGVGARQDLKASDSVERERKS